MTQVRIESSKGELLGEVKIDNTKPLLKQLEAADIEIPNACNIGMCGACLCNAPDQDDYLDKSLRGEPAFPLGEGEIMTCIGGVIETDEIITLKTMS